MKPHPMAAGRARTWCLAAGLFAAACLQASCATEEREIVGSGHVIERQTPAMVVATLRIAMPFDTVVFKGEAGQITLRAEDNLLEEIELTELAVSKWEIVAPMDLRFKQQKAVEIEVPFIDMVKVSYTDSIRFEDEPGELLREPKP